MLQVNLLIFIFIFEFYSVEYEYVPILLTARMAQCFGFASFVRMQRLNKYYNQSLARMVLGRHLVAMSPAFLNCKGGAADADAEAHLYVYAIHRAGGVRGCSCSSPCHLALPTRTVGWAEAPPLRDPLNGHCCAHFTYFIDSQQTNFCFSSSNKN